MILAGDVGGTHTRLALFEVRGGRPVLGPSASYPSPQHAGLVEIVRAFLSAHAGSVDRAAFGVAGPVRRREVQTTNLPWVVRTERLAEVLGLEIDDVLLMNDLEALAWSLDQLGPEHLAVIQAGRPDPLGNRGVLAAGTGLGEAALVRVGHRTVAVPGEGGHADLAPRTELEVELLRWLTAEYGRASYERVLSGRGLFDAYRFLRDRAGGEEPGWLAEALRAGDPAAVVSTAAMEGRCETCAGALDLFVGLYGAEAGNLALRVLATGGVFVGGGIAPRILPWLERPGFREAFLGKGRMRELLEEVPLAVVLHGGAALLGAARRAMEAVR